MSVPCRKLRFDVREHAEKALSHAIAAAERGNTRRQEQRVYDCTVCGGFHLTRWPETAAP